MKLTEKKENELVIKVSQYIAEALNPPPVISVRDTMKVLGLAVYVYITQVNQDIKGEDK